MSMLDMLKGLGKSSLGEYGNTQKSLEQRLNNIRNVMNQDAWSSSSEENERAAKEYFDYLGGQDGS